MHKLTHGVIHKRRKQLITAVFSLVSLLSLSACSSLGIEPWVKPYERQNLADPIMSNSRHPIADKHVSHVYEARESSRGAEGTGGGGCGCN